MNNTLTVDTCLFDFADTVAELNPRREAVVAEALLKERQIIISPIMIRRAFSRTDLSLPFSSLRIRSAAERREFYARYNHLLLCFLGIRHQVDPNVIAKQFDETNRHWVLKKGVRGVLNTLREQGYKIGILSNFDSILSRIVGDGLRIAECIDYLFVSAIEGVEKPDERFYTSFLHKTKLRPEKCSYIGDNYLLDYVPSAQLGFRSVLLDENRVYPKLLNSISNINQFPTILTKNRFRVK